MRLSSLLLHLLLCCVLSLTHCVGPSTYHGVDITWLPTRLPASTKLGKWKLHFRSGGGREIISSQTGPDVRCKYLSVVRPGRARAQSLTFSWLSELNNVDPFQLISLNLLNLSLTPQVSQPRPRIVCWPGLTDGVMAGLGWTTLWNSNLPHITHE